MQSPACSWFLALAASVTAVSAQSIDVTGLTPSKPGEGGGAKIAFEMGNRRMGWTHARWSVVRLDAPKDFSSNSGLRIAVRTAQVRSDAELAVAVLEADGSWYVCPSAVELTRKEHTAVVRFADFTPADFIAPPKPDPASKEGWFDENGRLDPGAVIAVAVGCINPLGIGTVEFTVTDITPAPADPARPAMPVEIRVPGRPLDINGTSMVPAGLFGSFNLPKGHTDRYRLGQDRRIHHDGVSGGPDYGTATTPMMITTVGDRVRPSPRLTASDWEARYLSYGEKFGAAAKAAAAQGRTTYVEFWNEPYLNWANKNRANFNPAFYDETKAKEGGEVRIKHDGQPAPHLRWTRQFEAPPWNWCTAQEWRRGRDASGKVLSAFAVPYKGMESIYGGPWLPKTFPPAGVKDGEKYRAEGNKGGEVELTAVTPWHLYDETQFSYWSGKGMLKMYIEPMLAFGQAVKKQHAATVFIAGWGNRPSEDHWAGFTQLYQETIDRGAAFIDGVCDHDYGGDPFKMAANYEFITAYGMAKHKKWLYSFNTETAMGGDPQAYPDAEVAKGALADRLKCRWTLSKLLHALATVPDKARSFSWFGYGGGWFTDSGEGVALQLLINLRGQLLQADSSDPDVIVVASIDGTDPGNPRPDSMGPGPEQVIAVINTASEPRTTRIVVGAPTGTKAGPAARLRLLNYAGPEGGPAIVESAVQPVEGAYPVVLAPGAAATLTFPLTGTIAKVEPVVRRQFFAPEFLREVKSDAPIRSTLTVDSLPATKPGRAWVRVVVERLAEGEGVLVFNGKELPMPAAVTPENSPWIRDIPVDPTLVRASNTLEFKVADPARSGFLLASASLFLESR